MAYIAEVVGRPGLYLVMSHGGEEIGSIEGINETWRWQLHSESPMPETSLTRAKEAVLKAARMLDHDLSASAPFDSVEASQKTSALKEACAAIKILLRRRRLLRSRR